MQPKKILIFGANSFLAKSIVHLLLEEFIVTGVARSDSELSYSKFNKSNLQEFDLSELLNQDIIVNCLAAGSQSNRWKDSNDEEHFFVNTYFPIKITEYLKKHNYKGVLITFGSYFEIGTNQINTPLTEQDILGSLAQTANPYILSKRLLSQYLRMAFLPFRNFHFILPTIFGKHEAKTRLLPTLMDAFKNNKSLALTDGNQVRQYLFAEELAFLIIEVSNKKESKSGIYNVPGSEIRTVREIYYELAAQFNFEEQNPFGKVKRYDEAMKFLYLSSTSLFEEYNWRPKAKISEIAYQYL